MSLRLLNMFQILAQAGPGRGHPKLQGRDPKRRTMSQYFPGCEGVGIPSRRRRATASQIPRNGAFDCRMIFTQTFCPLGASSSRKHGCFPTAMYSNRRNAKGNSDMTSPITVDQLYTVIFIGRRSVVACRGVSKAYLRTHKGLGTPLSLHHIAPRASPFSRARPAIDPLIATSLDVDIRSARICRFACC